MCLPPSPLCTVVWVALRPVWPPHYSSTLVSSFFGAQNKPHFLRMLQSCSVPHTPEWFYLPILSQQRGSHYCIIISLSDFVFLESRRLRRWESRPACSQRPSRGKRCATILTPKTLIGLIGHRRTKVLLLLHRTGRPPHAKAICMSLVGPQEVSRFRGLKSPNDQGGLTPKDALIRYGPMGPA